ncbi:hypothetical protein ACSBR2_042719 [Camellia fascicularis]
MALARLALKNLGQRVVVSPSCSSSLLVVSQRVVERSLSTGLEQRWVSNELLVRSFSTRRTSDGNDEKSEGREVAVSEEGGGKKFRLFPRRQRRRGLWRNNNHYELFPSGLENALFQATQNLNKLLRNLSPSRLIGRVKEHDECYKIRFSVPGLSKEDVKITIEDGVLKIRGEHKEESDHEQEDYDDDDDDDDEIDRFWSSMNYRYLRTSIMLPEDAKVDEIKAEMKDGELTITIPRTETPKKDVKEIEIQ